MTLSRTTSCIFYEAGRKACIIIPRPSEIHQQEGAEHKEYPPGKSAVIVHIRTALAHLPGGQMFCLSVYLSSPNKLIHNNYYKNAKISIQIKVFQRRQKGH